MCVSYSHNSLDFRNISIDDVFRSHETTFSCRTNHWHLISFLRSTANLFVPLFHQKLNILSYCGVIRKGKASEWILMCVIHEGYAQWFRVGIIATTRFHHGCDEVRTICTFQQLVSTAKTQRKLLLISETHSL